MYRHFIISFLCVLSSLSVVAQQDTALRGATIEIIQSYKPEVQRAPRPELTPHLPPVDTTTPTLDYSVPQQTLYYSYSSLPLRPLALDVNPTSAPFTNYVKAGGGNLSTLYLDAGISSLRGDNYETNFQVNHLSQAGAISDQKISLTGLDANGTYYKSGKAFGAQLGVHQNKYHYYGYDHSLYNYPIGNVSQAYTDISFAVDMKDKLEEGKKFTYHPSLMVNSFSDAGNTLRPNASELTIGAHLPFAYKLDSNTEVYLNADAILTTLNNSSAPAQNNNVISVAPGIRFSRGIFTGHASVAPTWGINGSLYILPDININFQLPETQFNFLAGWKGQLHQNTYKELAMLNPYMSALFTVTQTSSNEVYAGIKSNIGEHITFNGRASWWSYNNLPLFINDTAGDKSQFNIVYDTKVNAVGLQAAIRYQVAEVFSVGFSAQWLNFYNKSYEEVWHRPGVRFTGDIAAQPFSKLTINAYISFLDELYALESNNRTFKLNSVLDIGAGAEYEIIKRLNIFVQANNLLNNNYQRFYGYDAFGLNVFGGVRFKF